MRVIKTTNSWISALCTLNRLRADGSADRSSKKSRMALGSTRTPIEWAPKFLSKDEQQPEREVCHSTLCSTEFKSG